MIQGKWRIILIVGTCLFFILISMVIGSHRPGEIPVSKKSKAAEPQFKTVQLTGDAGLSIKPTYQPMAPEFPVVNIDYAGFGSLDGELLYVFDDARLGLYKKTEKEWVIPKEHNEGEIGSARSSVKKLSGRPGLFHVETFDETLADLRVENQSVPIPRASLRVLEKSTLAPDGMWGISFSFEKSIKRFNMDAQGTLYDVTPIVLPHIGISEAVGKDDLAPEFIKNYTISREHIFVVGANKTHDTAMIYDLDGTYQLKITIEADKIGAPLSVVRYNDKFIFAGTSGLSVFDLQGNLLGTASLNDILRVKGETKQPRILGLGIYQKEPVLCVAAELEPRTDLQAYFVTLEIPDKK